MRTSSSLPLNKFVQSNEENGEEKDLTKRDVLNVNGPMNRTFSISNNCKTIFECIDLAKRHWDEEHSSLVMLFPRLSISVSTTVHFNEISFFLFSHNFAIQSRISP